MSQDLQTRRRVRLWQWAVLPLAAVLLTAGAYLLWPGWHQLENKSAYAPWQVVGLALSLGIHVAAATWRSMPLGLVIAAVVTLCLTVVWCWDAATTPREDASLWSIGAVYLFFGSAGGLMAAWGVTLLVNKRMRGHPPRTT